MLTALNEYNGYTVTGDQTKQGYFYRAENLFKTGFYTEAILIYQKAIEIDPLYYDAYYGMGWSYECLGMHEQSIPIFQKLISMDKSNHKGYRSLAHVYSFIHRYSEATSILEKLIKLEPNNNMAYIQLADACISEGKYIQAEEILKKNIAHDARNDKARGRLGLMYMNQSKHDLVAQYYKEANDIRESYYIQETRDNFIRIEQMLDERKIIIICIQYPMHSVKGLMKI